MENNGAYLTEFSFKQLVKMTKIENMNNIDSDFFRLNIYDNKYLFYFFNQLELKDLFREKLILSENDLYIINYVDVPEREDNLNYVIKIKGKVKYHNSSNCVALDNGFKNFIMPENISRLKEIDNEKHKLIVVEIRRWFIENNFTVERYENKEINSILITKEFNKYFPEKYQIEPIIISQPKNEKHDFQWYIEKKGGKIDLERSFDKEAFLNNIDELIKQRNYLCSSKTMLSLSKFDFLVNKNKDEILKTIQENIENKKLKNVNESFVKNYGLDKLIEFWKKHRQLKKSAYNELSNYFKWTYNLKEKKFSKIYLENFNIEECSLCKNITKLATN